MSHVTHDAKRRLNLAILCSDRAPGLVQLLHTDERRGVDYEIACCITSSDTFSEEVRVERRGVVCLPHSFRRFCAVRGVDSNDEGARYEYDAVILGLLEPFSPDLLILLDYRLDLTPMILDRFDGRIVGVRQDEPERDGEDPSVEAHARIASRLVTRRPFDGPTLVRSWKIAPTVRQGARSGLRATIDIGVERQHRAAWSAVLAQSVTLAAGAIERTGSVRGLANVGAWELSDAEPARLGLGEPGRGTAASPLARV